MKISFGLVKLLCKIQLLLVSKNKGFFNKSATNFFLNKTKTALGINKILYSSKSTLDAIMNETRFLLMATTGTLADSESFFFDDFQA